MQKYQHIFFDLDRTLWDLDSNSLEAMEELYTEFRLEEHGIRDFRKFHDRYCTYNDAYWTAYRDGLVEKEVLRWIRFHKTFEHFGIQDKYLAENFSREYQVRAPQKPGLLPGTLNVLETLRKKYSLHIITNGFSETQSTKLRSGGIEHFFELVVNSDSTGFKKPQREIYDFALQGVGCADPARCLMVGDDFIADYQGARGAGWDAIWFNPARHEVKEVSQVHHLEELLLSL